MGIIFEVLSFLDIDGFLASFLGMGNLVGHSTLQPYTVDPVVHFGTNDSI